MQVLTAMGIIRPMKLSKFLPLLAGLTAASIWGGMYVVSKVVLEVIPPFALLSLRLLLGFLCLAMVLTIKGAWKGDWRHFWACLGVGFVGYGLSLGFQFMGTHLSGAANASLVTAATPALILPFAMWLLKERPGWPGLAALVLASLGVLAVIDPRMAFTGTSNFGGNLLLLGAALTWALYSVLVAKITHQGSVLLPSALMLLGGLPSSLIGGAIELSTIGIGTITAAIVAGVLFLGIISTAVAMFLWNYAFARLDANRAALSFFAQPVVGTLLAVVFLGEQLTILFLIGAGLIALGLLIPKPSRG